MNSITKPPRRCDRLVLVSDDTILGDFFRDTVGPGLSLAIETVPVRLSEARLTRLEAESGLVLDQRSFDQIENDLAENRPSVPVILVTGQLDRTTVRRLLAIGGNAIVPTSYERQLFLNAVTFAISGDHFFPSTLWMPYLEETLAVGAPQGSARNGGPLTRREHDVLCELARGKTNKMIAFSLGISEPTVKMHLAHLGKKLGVGNRTQLLTRAIRQGLIPDLAIGREGTSTPPAA